MAKNDLSSMSNDELWQFHQRITDVLEKRLVEEHHRLEEKLAVLQQRPSGTGTVSTRRE